MTQHARMPGPEQALAVARSPLAIALAVGLATGLPGQDEPSTDPCSARVYDLRPVGLRASQFEACVRRLLKLRTGGTDEVRAAGERWLVACVTAERHATIAQLLGNLASAKDSLVTYETRLATMSETTFQRHIAPLLRASDDTTAMSEPPAVRSSDPIAAVLGGGAAVNRLARLCSQLPDIETITQPRACTRIGEAARFDVFEDVHYVRDVDVRLDEDRVHAEPMRDVLRCGFAAEAHVLPLTTAGFVAAIATHEGQLERPIPVVAVKVAGTDHDVAVQVPQYTVASNQHVCRLRSGDLVVFAPPARHGMRRVLISRISVTAPSTGDDHPTGRRR